MEYIINKEVSVVIVTNGIKLADKEFCLALKRYNYAKLHLGISIKGSSDEEYLHNCGAKGFSLLIEGLKNCDEIGLDYSLSYVLTQENIQILDLFAQTLVENGINKTIFMAYCNYVITENDNQQDVCLQLEMDYSFAKKYDLVSRILSD